jgi:hypothetical protein
LLAAERALGNASALCLRAQRAEVETDSNHAQDNREYKPKSPAIRSGSTLAVHFFWSALRHFNATGTLERSAHRPELTRLASGIRELSSTALRIRSVLTTAGSDA